MPEIHVFGSRLFAAQARNGRATGLITTKDELALLGTDDVAAITQGAVVGARSYEDSGSLTMTTDGRLRVDTNPTGETVNLFAAPSPWGGDPWSSRKSPW